MAIRARPAPTSSPCRSIRWGEVGLALSVHPYSRINILYNRGPALDFRERLTDALHGELDFIRRPDIDEQDMILAILHQLAQPRFELCAPPPREAALEHGKLEPLAIAVHCLEHAPPPLLVGDVVGDDKQALVRHRSEEHTSELQSRENLVC